MDTTEEVLKDEIYRRPRSRGMENVKKRKERPSFIHQIWRRHVTCVGIGKKIMKGSDIAAFQTDRMWNEMK